MECTKQTCPALNCPDSEAYRPDPMACCKQCPTAPSTLAPNAPVNKELLGEEAQARGETDILSSGGCRFKGDVFENGEEWHPRIQPWGEMRCINCNCKVISPLSDRCSSYHCGSPSSNPLTILIPNSDQYVNEASHQFPLGPPVVWKS